MFVPPAKAVIDSWEALGNKGWNWETLQKYIKRTYTSPSVDKDTQIALGIEGWAAEDVPAKGPIITSFPDDSSALTQEAWAATFKSKDLRASKDPFIEASVGSFNHIDSVSPATKERSYATTAYYHPVKDRENLVVITGAHVEKILFDR